MSEKENFTAERVAKYQCLGGKKQTFYWDAKTSGLGVRITSAGAKSYIFESRLHGQTLRMTIGSPKDWSLGAAQAEARRLKTLTDQHIDPRKVIARQAEEARALKVDEKRRNALVAHVWQEYLAELKTKNSTKTKRPLSNRYIKDHENLATPGGEIKLRGKGLTEAGPLASLMVLKLTELTPAKVAEWLAKETDRRPTNAAHAYRLLRAFIRWTNRKTDYLGVVDSSTYNDEEVRKCIPANKSKDDVLQREQLASWFGAVRTISNVVISAYLQGLLLTGARREELASLRWDDVDFQWRSITIRDKVEGQRTIPLTPYLSQLLQRLPRRNEWVFSSPSAANGRLAEPRKAHTKALQMAGLPHVSLHGLRRSFGTLSEWCEVPTGVIAQIMGHKPSALAEKHYRRRPLDLLRMWHDRVESWMLESAAINFSS